MSQFDKYLDHVLEQLQSPNEEREDIREELLTHLNDSKMYFIHKGYSKSQAEKKALAQFGEANGIGKELQEAMYPFQRSLLYVIGLAMIVYGALFYLNMAFNGHELIPGWLAIHLIIGSIIVLCAINISFIGRHFYVLHMMTVVALAWLGFNIMVVETQPGGRSIFFGIYLLILIGLNLVYMFRNSYYSTKGSQMNSNETLTIKLSYILNLVYGMLLIAVSLFYVWVALIFSGISWYVTLPLIPFIAWLIFYKFQMHYIAKKPIRAIFSGLLFFVLVIIIPLAMIILI